MLKSSRVLFSKLPVRPVVNVRAPSGNSQSHANNFGSQDNKGKKRPTGLQVTPIGLAFIIGGVAYGIYLFRPTTRLPSAAMDTFKPQVAIIFGLGDSHEAFRKTSEKLGFEYINVQKDMQQLDTLVNKGKTRFFIEGFKDRSEMDNMAHQTVQPDLIFDFENVAADSKSPRLIDMHNPTVDSISDVVQKHNLI